MAQCALGVACTGRAVVPSMEGLPNMVIRANKFPDVCKVKFGAPEKVPKIPNLFRGYARLQGFFWGEMDLDILCPPVSIPQSGVEIMAVKGAATVSPKDTQNKMHQSLVILWTHTCSAAISLQDKKQTKQETETIGDSV